MVELVDPAQQQAFDEDADKWMRDKQLALEEVDGAVDDLIDRLEGQ